ncbi:hypothetical protein N7468_001082 [Penicillium chermesinum]|uniref:Uncharacterized protein n=1 Tax=Penicillium chermesinum TaxID=63820 RepID=A0A9W9TYA1_9EURO|nr:uncharacterized protein N7468_001082 [Penicillium chermesinum]KAJ5246099.1 hypothetical protein N7468_001082 [Penicillium chermesinum]
MTGEHPPTKISNTPSESTSSQNEGVSQKELHSAPATPKSAINVRINLQRASYQGLQFNADAAKFQFGFHFKSCYPAPAARLYSSLQPSSPASVRVV